jgi:hypothetical protein
MQENRTPVPSNRIHTQILLAELSQNPRVYKSGTTSGQPSESTLQVAVVQIPIVKRGKTMRKLKQQVQTQKEEFRSPAVIHLFRRDARPGQQMLQRTTASVLALLMLPLSLGTALAQDDGAPPPPDEQGQPLQNYQPLPQEQLNQLVAPIALYPDSLVAQVLAAATYPAQVVAAEQFVQQSGNYPPEQLASFANTQPWDPSIKSLVAFPNVLANLSQNMDWTTQLGNAYYNQPQDVLGSVQIMRQRAYEAGNLHSTQQLSVVYDPGNIVISPVSEEIVYVPYYNPWVVYGAPIPAYPHYYYGPPRGIAFGAGLAIGFGVGIAIGAFAHFNWGYHNWGPNWGSRTVVFNHNTYISRSVTVVNHGYYGHFDRNPQARAFNQQEAQRFGSGRGTVNNVTINRGGNTFNRGGNTFNNGGNNYNRGGNTFNNGGNTFNRGGQQPGQQPGGSFNRGAQAPQQPGGSFNRGAQPMQPTGGSFNRGGQAPQQAGGSFNRGGYGGTSQTGAYRGQAPQQGAARPQQEGARTAPSQGSRQPAQHAAPQHANHDAHAEHGGHEEHH